MDPVSPVGIKFEVLLQSAVDRQLVGSGKYFKYSNCFSNCASLMYGVINNHSFHNGNKRTGLLCMISCYTLHRCLSKATCILNQSRTSCYGITMELLNVKAYQSFYSSHIGLDGLLRFILYLYSIYHRKGDG